jgi:hypothetical protein
LKLPNARELRHGPGDPLSKAFELVVTPAIFGFVGFLVDRALGTVPIFTALFAVFVLGYMIWKLYVEYDAEMEKAEADKPWTRAARRKGALGG